MKQLLKSFLCVILLASPCAAVAQNHDTVLAKVDGQEITLGHVALFYETLPAQYLNLPIEQLYPKILDQLIQNATLATLITDRDNPRFVKQLENVERGFAATLALDSILMREITEDRLRALYEERSANMAPQKEWNAAHILVESHEESEAIIAELEAGADFSELAKEKSIGPSGKTGGELGWFSPEMMVPSFSNAVASLSPGDISEPVETQFGWHVILLNDMRVQETPPFETVAAELQAELQDEIITRLLDQVTEKITVERIEIEGDPAAALTKQELFSE